MLHVTVMLQPALTILAYERRSEVIVVVLWTNASSGTLCGVNF